MWRTLVASGILFSTIVVLFVLETPLYRYGYTYELRRCAAHQVLHFPQRTDVVLVGSSRMMRGVDPNLMSETLGVSVMNLGRSGFSTARTFAILTGLYEAGGRPGVVIMEAAMDEIRGQTENFLTWEAGAANVMSARQLIATSLDEEHNTLIPGLAAAASGMLSKLRGGVLLIAANVVGFEDLGRAPLRYGLPANDTKPRNICVERSLDTPNTKLQALYDKQRANRRARNEERFGNLETALETYFVSVDTSFVRSELYYLDQIRALTRQHGSTLVVVRLHTYAAPPLAPKTIHNLQEIVPEFVVPPPDLIRQTWDYFIDIGHFGPQARAIYTRWLSGAVRETEAL